MTPQAPSRYHTICTPDILRERHSPCIYCLDYCYRHASPCRYCFPFFIIFVIIFVSSHHGRFGHSRIYLQFPVQARLVRPSPRFSSSLILYGLLLSLYPRVEMLTTMLIVNLIAGIAGARLPGLIRMSTEVAARDLQHSFPFETLRQWYGVLTRRYSVVRPCRH